MDKWNQLVISNKSKIYHLYQWGTLINKAHGLKLVYLREEKGVLPLALVKSFIFGNRLISLPFADYGGPCASDEETVKKLILRAEEEARNLKVDFLEIRTPPDEKLFSLFEKLGFKRRDDYFTFLIDLNRGLEESWKAIGVKNRNMVGRARKSGVKIIKAKNKSDLKIFYRLYLETMKRLGSPPQPFIFFETIWDLFYHKNLLIPLAVFNNRYIAGGLFFLHQDIVHHSYSCSSKKNFIPGTNNLILWYVIEWAMGHGFKCLDLGRTRPGAGNVNFKKRWGGKPTSLPYFYKFYKKEIKERDEVKYKKWSDLWAKYLPQCLANHIGPWLIKQIG